MSNPDENIRNKVFAMMEDGILDPHEVAGMALRYLSTDEVQDMLDKNLDPEQLEDLFNMADV